MQLAIPDIRFRIMEGGTLQDLTVILLAVAVVALCVVILSTVLRAALNKRSLLVSAATEHLVHAGDDEGDPGWARHGVVDNCGNQHHGKPGSMHGSSMHGSRRGSRHEAQPDVPVFVPPNFEQGMH